MHLLLEEPVDVAALFTHGKVRPVRMRWNGRMYAPKTINLIHRTMQGEREYIFFSMSDDTNFFKLRFDASSLNWHIMELYTEG